MRGFMRLIRCSIVSALLCAGCGSSVEHGNVSFDVSPEGNEIVCASAEGDLYLFNLATKKVMPFAVTPVVESNPSYSPDNEGVVYSAENEDQSAASIYRRDRNGKIKRLTDESGVYDTQPAFSADGSRIVFCRAHRHRPYSMGGWTWDDWDVYVMDADGRNPLRLTNEKHYGISGAVFVNDGASIIYSADPDRKAGHLNPVLLQVDSNKPVKPRVVDPIRGAISKGAWASDPAMSPDGTKIAFLSDRVDSFHYDVAVFDLDAGTVNLLGITKIAPYNSNPVFTADGKRILFLAGTQRNQGNRAIYSLWSIGVDGNDAMEIADSDLFTNPEIWHPK